MARKTGSHSDITGPKVRDAAMRLFTEHGYAGVSMRQIASEVGVQAGALYLYTPNKQSLLFDLLLEQMRGAVERLKETDLSGPPEKQIEAFVRTHFQFHMGGRQGIFIPYTELRNLTPANYKRLEEMRRIYERELEKIIQAGAQSGAFDAPDSKLSTLVVISILNGVLAWYRPDGRVPLQDVEDHYVSVVKKALSAT
ncbi:MAG: TetR/AcrR family transcriptional regulator [Litoreibacter sp.]|nr:TetR/AcrR family transcriptional regulator [Litoreibacter sp.]